jgi:hypothetical protein
MFAGVSQSILQTWGGPINLKLTDFGAELSTPSTVKNDGEYDAFIAEIPTKRIQMRQPAPDSDDPLLKRPPVDFETQMLLVVRSGSIHGIPEITEVFDTAAEQDVIYTIPVNEDAEQMAQPGATGRYAAVLVSRTDARVRFTRR